MPSRPPTIRPTALAPALPRTQPARAPRLTFRERGYTAAWDRASRAYRFEHPLCRICEARGLVIPSEEVDHIIPHRGDQRLMWDRSNWQALCKRCHSIKSATEDGGAGSSHPTWLPQPACKVVLVSGPPGAGKTTWAKGQATRRDTVIDLDDCFLDVCGVHGHDADRAYLGAALRWRNRQIADLAHTRVSTAFVIVSAPTLVERNWWAERLGGAAVMLLNPGAPTCLARVAPHRQHLVGDWYAKAAGLWTAPAV